MRRAGDRLFLALIIGGAALSFAVILSVVSLILFRGLPAISFHFLTEQVRSVGADGGIFFQLAGTLILILTAAVIAVPVAAGAGIFHQMYLTSARGRRAFDSLLQALNAVPSIVFGLVGLAVLVQRAGMKKSWLAGGVVLAVMILPTMTVAFIEKLRAIPATTIEAAFGLGMSRSRVAISVLLVQGATGLLTGTLLGLARAAGETAPIMFTAAIFAGATIPHGIVDSPVLALPYHIFVLAQDSFDPAMTKNLWGSAVVLLALVGALSMAAIPLRLRVHEEGKRA